MGDVNIDEPAPAAPPESYYLKKDDEDRGKNVKCFNKQPT